VLKQVTTAGTLPASWQDGFYTAGDGLHILTRHLTQFMLFGDVQPPSAPASFSGSIGASGLTLSWQPGTDNSGTIGQFVLYVNGAVFSRFDGGTTSSSLGAFDATDTRHFALAETDGAGNLGAKTKELVAVPPVVGKTLDDATNALTARGLTLGTVTRVASNLPVGTVVSPTSTKMVVLGSTVSVLVSGGSSGSGGAGAYAGGGASGNVGSPSTATRYSFSVIGTKSFSLSKRRFIGARIVSSRSAAITATLLSPKGRLVYRWRLRVSTGVTVVRLVVPKQVQKPGRYAVVWRAQSQKTIVNRRIQVNIAAGLRSLPAASKVTPQDGSQSTVGVIVAAAIKGKLSLSTGTKLIPATPASAFALVAQSGRNIQVLVIDAHRYGLRPVRDIRLVFPNVRVLALVASQKDSVQALQAGATLALPLSATAAQIASAIDQLAHPRLTQAAKKR
jgi:hypothetical protein